MKTLRFSLLAVVLFALSSAPAFAGATITIVNLNAGSGTGFDDPTPAAPVGNNMGTTKGQQALNVFRRAAEIWGSSLDSSVEIRILASFERLACTADSAVLGSAGTTATAADFPGAQYPRTFYPIALANKLAGQRLLDIPGELRTRFNSAIGTPGCLEGESWYLGLDANEGANQTDLLAVLLHEFGHGLGFASFVNKKTGSQFKGWSDVYSRNIVNSQTGESWEFTQPSIRRKSTTSDSISWSGQFVNARAHEVLFYPAGLDVSGLTRIPVGTGGFGTPYTAGTLSGELVYTSRFGNALACNTGTAIPAGSLTGKIALVDRGSCDFTEKAKNVQNAGAIGMVVADWDPQFLTPQDMGGSDPSVTLVAVRTTKADGDRIKAALATTATATILQDNTRPRAGLDALGRVKLYAPAVVAPGSSVSHYDTSAFRNLLMEPFINGDLTHSLNGQDDLTLDLMKDLGW